MAKKPGILQKSAQDNPFVLSISDLMTVLMLAFALLLMASLLINQKLHRQYQESQANYQQCRLEQSQCLKQFALCQANQTVPGSCQAQLDRCVEAKNNIEEELKFCQEKLRASNILKAPQTISLKEVEGFTFDSGSGQLSATFINNLNRVLKSAHVLDILGNPNTKVIEIIGHTDGQPARHRYSNLDQQVVAVIGGQAQTNALEYGSNTDLGLIRAVSVYLYLKQLQNGKQLRADLQFRIYSAAQLIRPDGQLATMGEEDNAPEQRRRIELKFEAMPEMHGQ